MSGSKTGPGGGFLVLIPLLAVLLALSGLAWLARPDYGDGPYDQSSSSFMYGYRVTMHRFPLRDGNPFTTTRREDWGQLSHDLIAEGTTELLQGCDGLGPYDYEEYTAGRIRAMQDLALIDHRMPAAKPPGGFDCD